MKLKSNPKSPLAQAIGAVSTPAATGGESAHFGRSADFRQMFEVDLDRLRPRKDQPRRTFDEGELQSLAASIAARGVLQPILVRRRPAEEGEGEGTYEIVAGERRWRASRLAGRDRIRAILVDGDPAEIALIENIQRVDLTPVEEARGIKTLMDTHGYSQGQVAEVLGRSRVRVNETLRILDLMPDILACLTSDTPVPRTTLLQIAREADPERQRALWARAQGGAGEKAIRAARPGARPSGGAPAAEPAGAFFRDLARLSRRLPEVEPMKGRLDEARRREIAALRDRLDALLRV